jgi:hypothetical protein
MPEPVSQQLKIDAFGRDHAVLGCEAREIGEIRAIRPHGVRAETAFGGQVDRELRYREIELHLIIVTHWR